MKLRTERGNRSNLVSRSIEGYFGWTRDPYQAEIVPDWVSRFPNLPIVADGREETGHTRAGRGTTAFDLFRRREAGGLIRADFLSIKSDTIDDDDTLPNKLQLTAGNASTIRAILEGINRGASMPTVVFASRNDENGDPETDGFAIFLDVAPILRRGVADIDLGPYKKGQAPEAYLKWSSARKCGGAGKCHARADLDFPHVDETGRRWIAPDKVCYPELICSLACLGIKRSSWTPINMCELPHMLEAQNWGEMSF